MDGLVHDVEKDGLGPGFAPSEKPLLVGPVRLAAQAYKICTCVRVILLWDCWSVENLES